MSAGSVSKSVLSTPSDNKSQVSNIHSPSDTEPYKQIKFEYTFERALRHSQKEAHQARIRTLRKEIEFLNNTNWQYENNSSQ